MFLTEEKQRGKLNQSGVSSHRDSYKSDIDTWWVDAFLLPYTAYWHCITLNTLPTLDLGFHMDFPKLLSVS